MTQEEKCGVMRKLFDISFINKAVFHETVSQTHKLSMSVKKTTKIHAAPTPDTLTTEDIVGSKVDSAEQTAMPASQSSPASEGYRPQQRRYQRSDFGNNGHDLSAVPTETVKGILDVQPEGHGFLRPKFIPSSRDIYISQSQIRRFLLRPGDLVSGLARPPKDTERYYGLLKVETINDKSADEIVKRP